MITHHPAPGVEMPAGGVFFDDGDSDEPIECDRCGDLATRNWEGREFLQLCDSCHRDLGRWLDG